jgi:hypothetical protein
LNATSQNDVIKIKAKKIAKKFHELWSCSFINKKGFPLQHSFIAPLAIGAPLLHLWPLQVA